MDASVITTFREKVVQQPEVFFTPSEEIAAEIKTFTKHAFDRSTKYSSKEGQAAPLEELYVDGFDADQIWEQLRLLNGPLVSEMTQRIKTFHKTPESILLFPSEKEESEQEQEEEEEGQEESEADSDAEEEEESDDEEEKDVDSADSDDEEDQPKKKKAKKSKKARDVAEDGFFDWDEMDKAAEEEEGEDDEEELDLNDDIDEEDDDDDNDDSEMEEGSDAEDAAEIRYDDFFENPENEEGDGEEDEEDDGDEDVEMQADDDEEEYPTIKKPTEEAGEIDEEELAERGIMSSHQRQRMRLQKEIKELEEQAISDKPWLLKGEVRSGARPENSLLEAVLDYDRPVRAAPVITEEVSIALEEMIKKRILEEDFDDVIRKFAGNEQDEKNKLEEVSMEKSKEGLGEIYEKEYMKTAMGFEADDESKQDQEEIEVMFKSLCWKLDALSNYQFTPKPAVKELQVKPAVPAIAMEEVVPISVSDANLKAPEEVYDKKRKRGEAVLQSKEEMTQTERKALRNAKKHARRKEKRQREFDEKLVAKLNPGLGNKYEKKKMLESIAGAKNITTGKQIEGSSKQFSNSKEFFSRLQDEVQEKIRNVSNKKSE
ncbi:u3 small nucleolar ribonucleoprotein MPP10 [Phytophthora boehmeriae]|uniref:U3 small nucleolar ribonucleoprotein protein MPP10 n=1 Tax=Phytophthora boehmeriae TaxID=109152 RepID=A0A8T1X777_9STRA|nr:u3 small nucleolar ribonucleoprotein MPP10 [Phytophthora boehmeriae]